MKIYALAGALALLSWAPVVQAKTTERHAEAGQGIKLTFNGAIPNIPGKSLKTVLVTYAPGGSTPAHSHAKSAFILGYVLEGEIASAVNDGEIRTFKAGETFTENPGDHHAASYNASKTKPAKLLAIFVVDTSDNELTTLDAK